MEKEAERDQDRQEAEEAATLLRLEKVGIVTRMQKQFDGRILRRTAESVDWRGQPLIDLPPYQQIRAYLTLTEQEMAIIIELAEIANIL